MQAMWCLTILFIGKVFSLEDDNFCFEEGITWNHDDQIDIEVNIPTASECQNKCKADGPCVAFTWNTLSHPHFPKVCSLFNSTDQVVSCSECLSGPASCLCSEEYACNIVGDNIIDIIQSVPSEEECQVSCKNTENCKIYTWFNEDAEVWKSTCFLFMYCDDTDITCTGCFSGPPTCSSSTTPPATSTLTSTGQPEGCNGDPLVSEIEYGYWFCVDSSEAMTCYLECDLGYAATGRTVTTCTNEMWTVPPASMACEPAVALINGGDSGAEVLGKNIHIQLPRPSSEDENVDFDRAWMNMAYADSKVIMCGGGWHPSTWRTCLEMTSNNNTWASHSNMTTNRQFHGMVSMFNKILVIGGHYSDKTMESTDPWNAVWEKNDEVLPEIFDNSCEVKVSADMIIYTGGWCCGGLGARYAAVAYNRTTNQFRTLPNMIHKREYHSCSLIKDGNMTGVLVAGGKSDRNGNEGISSSEFFNLATEEWTSVGSLNTRRMDAHMVFIEDTLKIMGGYYVDTWNGDYVYLTSIEEFNITSMTWSNTDEELFKHRSGSKAIAVPKSMFNGLG